MYLEVSDRRTGKTTRLMNNLSKVYNDVKSDKSPNRPLILFVGLNHNYMNEIVLKNHLNVSDFFKIAVDCKSILMAIRGNSNRKIKLFVDEFDGCRGFKEALDELVSVYPEIIADGYFSSSMNGDTIIEKLLPYIDVE